MTNWLKIKEEEIEKTNGSPAGHSSSALSPGFPMAAGLTGETDMLRNSHLNVISFND